MGYQNFFATKLYTDIGASDTAITLETVPTQTSGRLVLEARNATQREIISYTGIAGNQVTGVVRGVGGTTAKPHTRNALVEMNLTAEDVKDLYDAFNTFAATNSSGWYTLATPNITSVVYNGNRSYTMTLLGDRTNLLNPGTRIRTTRTTAAPTQSTSLNGTTQYWVKTSPNKLTFTDDFVVSAWVKLSSYQLGNIVTRFNGTSGWRLDVNTSGQIEVFGYNASGSNYRGFNSYQSLPLNKWVHIAVQVDMSAYTATTTTMYCMIDGVDVPISLAQGGTNPTSLIQAGNLEIGSTNGGTGLLPGNIAQVAIYNAKVTQATILASISKGLTGTETSLASAYSFNGVATDLNTTTPNDLTANGSAVATNANSPFGGQANGTISSTLDYGIVQSATYSTNTTLVVQVPEGCTIPTNSGGVTAVSYSSAGKPYGMPIDDNAWTVTVPIKVGLSMNPGTSNWQGTTEGMRVSVPIGKWSLSYKNTPYIWRSSGSPSNVNTALSTTTDSTGMLQDSLQVRYTSVNQDFIVTGVISDIPFNASVATTVYPVGQSPAASNLSWNHSSDNHAYIKFKNTYI